jgi:hypothetical protein
MAAVRDFRNEMAEDPNCAIDGRARLPSEPGGARHPRAAVDPSAIENENDGEKDCSKHR